MTKKIEEIAEQIVFSLTEGYDEEDISVVGDIITSAVSEAQKKQMEVDIAYKNQCVEAETERCAKVVMNKLYTPSPYPTLSSSDSMWENKTIKEIAKAIRDNNE